jgi:hypothetical protein
MEAEESSESMVDTTIIRKMNIVTMMHIKVKLQMGLSGHISF